MADPIDSLRQMSAGIADISARLDRLTQERNEAHARAQRAELERNALLQKLAFLDQVLTAQSVTLALSHRGARS